MNAVRPNVYTAEQVADWEADPKAAFDRLFPGYRPLADKYGVKFDRKPGLSNYGDNDEATIGYAPTRHFGTFLEELRRVDAEGGADAVRAIRCPY